MYFVGRLSVLQFGADPLSLPVTIISSHCPPTLVQPSFEPWLLLLSMAQSFFRTVSRERIINRPIMFHCSTLLRLNWFSLCATVLLSTQHSGCFCKHHLARIQYNMDICYFIQLWIMGENNRLLY